MYRNSLREGAFSKAPMVADPVSLFDGAPDGDGAAALIITNTDIAQDMVAKPVIISASSASTDKFMLQERDDLLWLSAVEKSVTQALSQANLTHSDIDLFEVHDAYTILSSLSLEASGFAKKGEGWKLAQSGEISINGNLPISTFGGLKSRGNPAGASGIYQAVEAVMQLRNIANENQVNEANTAMIQSIGGLASTVVTHILQN